MKIFVNAYHGNLSKKTQSWLETHCTKTEDDSQPGYLFNGTSLSDFVERWNDKFMCYKGDEPNIWFVFITDHINFSQR
jgi:hypothetical protein